MSEIGQCFKCYGNKDNINYREYCSKDGCVFYTHICANDYNFKISMRQPNLVQFLCYELGNNALNLSANGEYEIEVKYCPFCGYKR
jgi:hypothetical protein